MDTPKHGLYCPSATLKRVLQHVQAHCPFAHSNLFCVTFELASSSLSGLLAHVGTRLVSMLIMTLPYQLQQHLQKNFSFGSGFHSNISHQNMFISGTQNQSHS
ncbi:hypothetical protein ILYODFUR_026018 [Ilyodon furcidens]|uniref:Uncharacterized protein n=1 Tax=Ilyodon furcidens TaxID=33524 RepID=A0ABV0UJ59_9TELE